MKTIKTYEEALENARQGKKIEINRTVLRAYDHSKEAGAEILNFDDVIWEEDIPEILEECKKEGIKTFTVSSNFSGLLKTLAAFEENGCRLAGLTKVPERFEHCDLKGGTCREMLPAARIEIG